ncbi:PTS sugar transporter subunit IIA [Pseudalkalibacillus salsuginis]|uniref:PTS sugar transporter subunit IIA n=1 Tax=Pseudalkalibacillus salsuginis TaxID=2910972 RepID=UPI001F33E286|nr:PTS sugar transporter subunit IIA [Pseudalkalibacillus salsuginis]MCF6410182.1 PTS sugar transporter subunit IIA [Pseudalkalibacillus salsuginis]
MSDTILTAENIVLDAKIPNKKEAIRFVGGILYDQGYVEQGYIGEMLKREEITSTYMGNFVAIPHGTDEAKKSVKETGLSIVTVPDGVDFGDGNTVKLLIGIAGKGDEHLEILSKIAIVCSEEANIDKILQARTAEEVISIFDEVN